MPSKTPSAQPTPSTQPQLSGVILRAPGELKPSPNNPRRHDERQFAKLAASMRMYGFTSPVIVDEKSTILGGHARVEVARRLGFTEIPTLVLSGLTKSQKRAYVLADNKLALLSTWDTKLLKSENELLIQDDFEIELTGFSTAEVDLMLYLETGDPDDQLPDVDEQEVVTRKGDLWTLGVHRLLCGSALDAAAYERLMQGQRAQMTITDPPYNVKIDGHVCGNGKVKHAEFAMASGEMSPAEFEAFLRSTCTLIGKFSQDGAICYVFMDWRHSVEVQNAARPIWGPARQLCTWVKDNAGMGTTNSSSCSRTATHCTSTTSSSVSTGDTAATSGSTPV
jgi:hypothetical protein